MALFTFVHSNNLRLWDPVGFLPRWLFTHTYTLSRVARTCDVHGEKGAVVAPRAMVRAAVKARVGQICGLDLQSAVAD